MTLGGSKPPRFSIIVASWDRPEWLVRCVLSLRQQNYPAFEIIVVAQHSSLDQLDTRGLKTVETEEANLSKARNLGVMHAAGDICVFIDDDAVAEPMWLYHLAVAFGETSADAVVGFVRGRNGISFQSRVASVDAEAETHVESNVGEAPGVPILADGRALKLIGTNFAIRTLRIRELGGFDPNMRYFLEDADLSLRLRIAGHRAAVAPLAQVHHGFAKSSRRTSGRTPIDLHDIGRSTAIFLQRHFDGDQAEILERTERREFRRLVEHMVQGNCEPRHVAETMTSLREGWREGIQISPPVLKIGSESKGFLAIEPVERKHEVFAAPLLRRRNALVKRAEESVQAGGRASVFSFSLTLVRHYVRYSTGGVWVQTGGLFGRADRDDKVVRWCNFAQRVEQEISRIAKIRGLRDTVAVKWWASQAVSSGDSKSEGTQ